MLVSEENIREGVIQEFQAVAQQAQAALSDEEENKQSLMEVDETAYTAQYVIMRLDSPCLRVGEDKQTIIFGDNSPTDEQILKFSKPDIRTLIACKVSNEQIESLSSSLHANIKRDLQDLTFKIKSEIQTVVIHGEPNSEPQYIQQAFYNRVLAIMQQEFIRQKQQMDKKNELYQQIRQGSAQITDEFLACCVVHD